MKPLYGWILGLVFCVGCWVGIGYLSYKALPAHPLESMAVSAGQWKHRPGFYDYNNFTENNK